MIDDSNFSLLIWIVLGATAGLVALYWVIRLAVTHALVKLRDGQTNAT
jgi:hypothetical protein